MPVNENSLDSSEIVNIILMESDERRYSGRLRR